MNQNIQQIQNQQNQMGQNIPGIFVTLGNINNNLIPNKPIIRKSMILLMINYQSFNHH